MDRFGADAEGINPEVPVRLIIDHFGLPNAVQLNSEL
jgi:aconitate hydratase